MSGTSGQKIVVLHGFSPEEARLAMRAIKEGVATASDTAFAMTTETNLDWKLSFLVEHVTEEHREFKAMMRAQSTKPKD